MPWQVRIIPTYTSAVDAVVDPAKCLYHVRGSRLYRRFLRDIHVARFNANVRCSCRGLALGSHVFGSIEVHVRDENASSTVFGEANSTCSTNAAPLKHVLGQ